MAFPYEQLVAGAKQLIDEAGTDCVLVVKELAPDAKEWDAPTVEKRYPFRAAFLTPKEKLIAGSLVVAGELKVLTYPMNPPLSREAALTARIIRPDPVNGDEVWTVNAFADTKPALISVLYTFKVTR